MTKTIIMTTLIIYLGLCIQFMPRSYGGSISGKVISNVSVSSKVFNPSRGQDVKIKYKLSEQSQVKIGIYDPEERLIRVMATEGIQGVGYNTVVWDGRDGMGNIVPDEAYTYAIFAWDNDRQMSRYYPVENRGETLMLMDSGLDRETGRIDYVLPNAGRVRIRIGIEDGPLLLTLLDWAPRQAGKNSEQWDGKDSAGLRDLLGDKKLTAVVSVFSLRMNSIITEGNGTLTMEADIHHSITASEEISRKTYPDMTIDHDRFTDEDFSSHGRHRREDCREPEFRVEFPGEKAGTGIPVLKGVAPVRIVLDKHDEGRLVGNRFEIKLYVDDLFMFEEEQGLNPYTYKWNTRGIREGNHILTVNVIEAGGMDHIGTESLRVRIRR